jgi:hypothetical protein
MPIINHYALLFWLMLGLGQSKRKMGIAIVRRNPNYIINPSTSISGPQAESQRKTRYIELQ